MVEEKDTEITGLKACLETTTARLSTTTSCLETTTARLSTTTSEKAAEIKELKREKREVEIEAEETKYMVQKAAAENEASMQEQLKTQTFHPGMRLAIREEASSTEYSAIVQTFEQKKGFFRTLKGERCDIIHVRREDVNGAPITQVSIAGHGKAFQIRPISASLSLKPVWEFDDGKGNWNAMEDEKVHNALETAYQAHQSVNYNVGRWSYTVDFSNHQEEKFEQLNTQTNKLRPLRRTVSSEPKTKFRHLTPDELRAHAVSLARPKYWANSGSLRVKIDDIHGESSIAYMTKLMKSSIMDPQNTSKHGMDKLKVTKVERIENSQLFDLFESEKYNLRFQLNAPESTATRTCLIEREGVKKWLDGGRTLDAGPLNEFWLWHGTKSDDQLISDIVHNGLSEKFSNLKNSLYGAGIYFADNSSKSHQYVTNPTGSGAKAMFLCRVAMGAPYLTNKQHKEERKPPGQFNSIFAEKGVANSGSQFHNEYVIFEKNQVYPEYLVWYTVT